MKTESLYLNRPQMLVQAVQASTTVAILPRGGGKSSGVGPSWFLHRVKLMPGGASAIVGASYKQLLSRTLPPFLGTLKKMGCHEGIDFVVGCRPPNYWEASPLVPPKEFKDTIHWCNGHVTYLVSQDRAGSPNSLSIQFFMADESRFLNKERFDEDFIPTLRGNMDLFGHLPEYLSRLYMTDQPTTASARWLFDFEKEHDDQLIEALVNLHMRMQDHLREMEGELTDTRMEEIRRSYNNLKAMYDNLRLGWQVVDGKRKKMGSTLFIEGNLMDNIHILGMDAIRRMKQTMTPLKFRVSIIGKRMKKVIGSFYPDLDDELHTYPEETNYTYWDTLDINAGEKPNWQQDLDLNQDLPLIIGSDHGASYNGFTIGQDYGHKLRVVNNMYVLEGQMTEDLVHNFNDYYGGFPSNEVWFIYDQTHIAKSGKARSITYTDEVVNTLKSLGWNVKEIYLGQTPDPDDRYNLWSYCLRGRPGYHRVEFNREKCETLIMSMHDTLAKAGTEENTIKKDKSAERDKSLSQEKATHGPDSADILLWGVASPEAPAQQQQRSLPPIHS